MTKLTKGFDQEAEENKSAPDEQNSEKDEKKGPLSFLSGSITSLIFSFVALLISRKIVIYFSEHTVNYSSPIAESVATGFKTVIIGISFLATFTFGFIGLGLMIVFIKSLFAAKEDRFG